MKRLLWKLALTVLVGGALGSIPAAAQESPTTKRAARVRITRGPELERVEPGFAIVRWTSNNPGGSPVHFGIVRFGTDPAHLNQTAQSPVRVNPDHSSTVFRVRLEGLAPRTTYHYAVDSMEANGRGDGVKATVASFTTR